MNSDQKPTVPTSAAALREAQQRHAEARRRQREALAAARSDQGVTPDGLQRATGRLPHHQALGLLRAVKRQEQRARDGHDLRLAGWWSEVAAVVEARTEVEPGAEALLRGRRRSG